MINWTIDSDMIPLFHIDGTLNLADLLTKQHCLGTEDVSGGSDWQEGKPWMKMEIDEMPLKKYSDLTIPSSLEK